MRPIRFAAPLIATVAFSIVLAACGEARANPEPIETPTPTPVVSPSVDPAPKPTPKPTPTPIAMPKPKPQPTVTPTPKPQPTVIDHDVPMLARSLADRVNVRAHPDLSAPLLRWGEDDPFDVQLAAGQRVEATFGPLYSEGESWYRVSGADDRFRGFAGGWVAGRFLERVGDYDYPAHIGSVTVLGGSGRITADVAEWSPLTVELAAAPIPDAASCQIDVSVVDTQGRSAEVVSLTTESTTLMSMTSPEVEELYQDVAGTVSIQVAGTCSAHVALLNYPF